MTAVDFDIRGVAQHDEAMGVALRKSLVRIKSGTLVFRAKTDGRKYLELLRVIVLTN
jgi:hypothetical protein